MGKESLGSTISAPLKAGGISSAASLSRISPNISGISRPIGFEGRNFSQASAFISRTPESGKTAQLTSPNILKPNIKAPNVFSSQRVERITRPGIEISFGAKPKVESFTNVKPKIFREKLNTPSPRVSGENFKWTQKPKNTNLTITFDQKVDFGLRKENIQNVVEVPKYVPRISEVLVKRTYTESVFLANIQRTEKIQAKINTLPQEVVKTLPQLEKPKLPEVNSSRQLQPELKQAVGKLAETPGNSLIRESQQISKTLNALLQVGLAKTEVITRLNETLTEKKLKVVEVPRTSNGMGGGKRVFIVVATGQPEPNMPVISLKPVKDFRMDMKALENRKKAGAKVVKDLFDDPNSKLVGVKGWQIAENLNQEFTNDKKGFTSAINPEDDPTPTDTVKVINHKLGTVWSVTKAHEEVQRTIFYNPPVDLGKGVEVTDQEVNRVLMGKADASKGAGILEKTDRVIDIVVAKAQNNLSKDKNSF